MPTKLYIGNLPYSLTESQLRQIFTDQGLNIVSDEEAEDGKAVQMISDRQDPSRVNRGICFAQVPDGEADKAIETLNGYEVEGRKLVVNVARPRTDKSYPKFSSNNRFSR